MAGPSSVASGSWGGDMSEWRLIETAPEDGKYVLLWWPYWRHRAIIGWREKGVWRSDEALSEEGEPPTHWMPLPSSPLQA